jgi:hypothetical protein
MSISLLPMPKPLFVLAFCEYNIVSIPCSEVTQLRIRTSTDMTLILTRRHS